MKYSWSFLEIFIGCCTLKYVQLPWMMFLGSVINIQGCPTEKHADLKGTDLGVGDSAETGDGGGGN